MARRILTREKVLVAAMEIADREGLGALTMRRLAGAAGVQAMSLYNHIRDKEDLLDALADRVAGEIVPPEAGQDWLATIRERTLSARAVLRRHPWAVPLLESRPAGPDRMAADEARFATLRRAGFSLALAHRAFLLLDGMLYGSVLQEAAWPYADAAQIREVAGTLGEMLPADRYPYLRELVLERVVLTGPADEGAFAFGLDLVLDGLERARDAEADIGRSGGPAG
jgi:AcrR family transcriptional regulator